MNSYRNPRASLVKEPPRYASSPSFFVARRSSDQTIPANTGVDLQYDTSVINDNGCFNFSLGHFVCPKAGRMFIGLTATIDNFSSGTPTDVLAEINVSPDSGIKGNGSIIDKANLAGGQYAILKGNIIATVQVGAVVKSIGYSFGGSAKTNSSIFGGESLFFFGYYLT